MQDIYWRQMTFTFKNRYIGTQVFTLNFVDSCCWHSLSKTFKVDQAWLLEVHTKYLYNWILHSYCYMFEFVLVLCMLHVAFIHCLQFMIFQSKLQQHIGPSLIDWLLHWFTQIICCNHIWISYCIHVKSSIPLNTASTEDSTYCHSVCIALHYFIPQFQAWLSLSQATVNV